MFVLATVEFRPEFFSETITCFVSVVRLSPMAVKSCPYSLEDE